MSKGNGRRRCNNAAGGVQGQALLPVKRLTRKCEATTVDGRPCPATPGEDGRCFWHSDRFSESEKEIARLKGGMASRPKILPLALNPRLRSDAAILEYIEETAGLLTRGELDPYIGYLRLLAAREARALSYERALERVAKLERMVRGR